MVCPLDSLSQTNTIDSSLSLTSSSDVSVVAGLVPMNPRDRNFKLGRTLNRAWEKASSVTSVATCGDFSF